MEDCLRFDLKDVRSWRRCEVDVVWKMRCADSRKDRFPDKVSYKTSCVLGAHIERGQSRREVIRVVRFTFEWMLPESLE